MIRRQRQMCIRDSTHTHTHTLTVIVDGSQQPPKDLVSAAPRGVLQVVARAVSRPEPGLAVTCHRLPLLSALNNTKELYYS